MDYVNELTHIPAANAVPDYVTSVDEVAFYINEGVERTCTGFEKQINYASKKYFQETGNSLVFAENGFTDGLKKIKEKITKVLNTIWGYIKAAFEKVFNFIKESCQKFKNKINDKIFKGIKENLQKKNADQYMGIVHDYGRLDKVLAGSDETVTTIKKTAIAAQKALNDVMDPGLNKKNGDIAASAKLGNTPTGRTHDITAVVGNTDNKSDATKALTEKFSGSAKTLNVRDVLAQFDTIKKFTIDYGTNVKTAKKLFDTEKKIIADVQKEVNKAKNINAKEFSKLLSTLSTAMTITTNAACRSLAQRHKEFAKVLSKASSKKTNVVKDDKKTAQTESASIDSLFDL